MLKTSYLSNEIAKRTPISHETITLKNTLYLLLSGMIDLSDDEDWLAQANIEKVIPHPNYRYLFCVS
jgi:hypothetical protein